VKYLARKGAGLIVRLLLMSLIIVCIIAIPVNAEPVDDTGTSGTATVLDDILPKLGESLTDTPEKTASTIQLLLLLTVLTLVPSILVLMTGFTRIVIVMSFVRNAMGTQQMPPNQVLIGLSLFLTLFLMSPVITEVYDKAYQPMIRNEITQEDALENAMQPIRNFMFKQTRNKDLELFLNLAKQENPESLEEIPSSVLIPAFITSEIKTAFQIGFWLYLPFIIIDMVVASTLMSMGMMMLPPVMISMPFKILLFILVDGWNLVVEGLIKGFK